MDPQTEDIQVGDVVTVYGQFRNAAGGVAAPTVLTLVYRKPNGTKVTLSSGWTSPSTGRYEYPLPIDQHGEWEGEWRGTGANAATLPWRLRVQRSRVEDPV